MALTKEAELELAERWQLHQDKKALDSLVLENIPLVHFVYRKYFSALGAPSVDTVQEGTIGLIRAAKKFRHDHGNGFATYAVPWIRQGMQRHLLMDQSLIMLGKHWASRRKQIYEAREMWLQGSSYEEIGAHLGMRADSIEALIPRLIGKELPLDEPIAESHHGGASKQTLESVTDSGVDVEGDLIEEDEEEKRAFNLRRALPRLPEQWRFVLEQRYCHGKTLKEIGRRLGLCRERVRQIETLALHEARKLLEGKKSASHRSISFRAADRLRLIRA
jgi:DNA-directed RNA polymerase sigma subunit (sigma70/sigma32)